MSVIVPAYNAATYLDDALRSIQMQTLTDIEIIVVDDGSTDETGAIARKAALEDDRVRVLTKFRPSGRPSCARNEGLRIARGRFIALLDADDVSVPTRLESAVGAMELTGALFAFADMRRLYQETGTLAPLSALESARFTHTAEAYLQHVSGDIYLCARTFPAYLLTYVAVNTPTVVFNRDLLHAEESWFDESLIRFEDLDMWYRWAEHTRFVFINEVHAIVRKHQSSLTAADPLMTRIDGIAVQSAHFRRLRPRLSPEERAAAALHISELQFHVAYAQWTAGRLVEARRWFLESWQMKPTVATLLALIKSYVPHSAAIRLAQLLRRRAE